MGKEGSLQAGEKLSCGCLAAAPLCSGSLWLSLKKHDHQYMSERSVTSDYEVKEKEGRKAFAEEENSNMRGEQAALGKQRK